MGRKKGLLVLLVISLIGGKHTVEPWEEFVGTVIAVKDDGSVFPL